MCQSFEVFGLDPKCYLDLDHADILDAAFWRAVEEVTPLLTLILFRHKLDGLKYPAICREPSYSWLPGAFRL